ncbi:MAG: hypothetical protein IT461_11980, partial [Planctomycetes bacterium]|nr:hypothetical protein [Planctomycetota bacterium]
QLTPEEKAQAKAQHEEAMREYEKKLAAWRIELEQWRISKRMRVTDDDGCLEEQKAGEFFPRPAHEPAIGFTLAPAPTLEQLKEQALTANVVEKPKAPSKGPRAGKAKAPVAPAPVASPVPGEQAAPAPLSQPTGVYSEEEHIETAAELGYGLDKNQMTFGF